MREVWSKRLALLGLTGVLLTLMSRNCVVDLDLFHEFALIHEGLATGALAHVDVFSYVPTVRPAVHTCPPRSPPAQNSSVFGMTCHLSLITSHLCFVA